MVFTLHRYIFRDLIKTFFLATLVLSVVLGLGTMLKPLREYSVDIRQVPELLFCTFPMTLTMVIPIAALLSATINYGRLAVDNEINACRSSGIGLMTLIYPAVALALLVGMATLLLAFHVIPRFAQRFENIFTSDVESILYRNIEKQGNLGDLLSGFRIHADRAVPEEHCLKGVAIVELGKGKQIERIITARELSVDLKSQQDDGRILLRLKDWTVVEGESAASMGDYTFAIPMPAFFRDDIKFKDLDALKAIRADMTLFREIRQQLDTVRGQVLLEWFFQYCDRQLKEKGVVELEQPDRKIRLYAGGCQYGPHSRKTGKTALGRQSAALTPIGNAPLEVKTYPPASNTPERFYQAPSGRLLLEPQFASEGAVLSLEKVAWHPAGDSHQYYLGTYDFSRIQVPDSLEQKAQALDLGQILQPSAPAELFPGGSESLTRLVQRLQEECRRLHVEIEIEIQTRLAFGVSCVALVLLGTALGIVFRSGHLLTAFGVSFIPAAFCLITIFTGKHLAEKSDMPLELGILFLWSGILIVALLNLFIYRSLLKR